MADMRVYIEIDLEAECTSNVFRIINLFTLNLEEHTRIRDITQVVKEIHHADSEPVSSEDCED